LTYSLNEIDALCRKAARGAGYNWGHAEDAGKAARWLQSLGLPGAEILLNCLNEGTTPQTILTIENANWRGDGPLCPLVTGASLSDHAATLASDTITLHDVRHPILLAPFAAAIAAQTHLATRLEWPGASVTIHGQDAQTDGDQTDGDQKALLATSAPQVTCRHVPAPTQTSARHQHRALLTADIYNRLAAFAQRTYAPATEASRKAGAGAGLGDND